MVMRNPFGVDKKAFMGNPPVVGPNWKDNTHGRLCHFKEVTSCKQNGQRQRGFGACWYGGSSRVCARGIPVHSRSAPRHMGADQVATAPWTELLRSKRSLI